MRHRFFVFVAGEEVEAVVFCRGSRRRCRLGFGGRFFGKGDKVKVVAFVCDSRCWFCLDRFGRCSGCFGGEGEEVELVFRFGSGFVCMCRRLRFHFGGRRFFAGK